MKLILQAGEGDTGDVVGSEKMLQTLRRVLFPFAPSPMSRSAFSCDVSGMRE